MELVPPPGIGRSFFGAALGVSDGDGDGELELLVSANGEGVYVYRATLDAGPSQTLMHPPSTDRYSLPEHAP